MKNAINTENALADNELTNISGGNNETYQKELDKRGFCYKVGDVVEVKSWFGKKYRARIIDRGWDLSDDAPNYELCYIDEPGWFSFVPRYTTSKNFL